MSFRANPPPEAAGAELPGAYAFELVSLCARLGVQTPALLDGTGLSLEALKDPATRITLPACAALVERARRLTGEPALAFWMGTQMRLSWHGFLGFAAMTAATVREALEMGERFSLTRTAAFGVSSYVEGETASLVLEERVPLGTLREFAVIALLVGIAQIANDATGRVLTGTAECAFPEPAYARGFLARLGAGAGSGAGAGAMTGARAVAGVMRFGAPSNRLVFDASILDLPLVTADPVAMELARAQCDRELASIAEAGGFVGRVRSAIARGGRGIAPLEEVARRLHVSTRTLKRRLAAHGSSYSTLLDEVRMQRALLLLEDRSVPLPEVADRLGYSDVANFTRAFRRWTGSTPAAFRGATCRRPSGT